MREALRAVGVLGALAVVYELSNLAFTKQQRMEIGRRFNWKCQWERCTRSFQQGFMMEINHIVPTARGGKDDVKNGTIYCVEHHATFHDSIGDKSSANFIRGKLKKNPEGRTWGWLGKKR